MIGFGSRWDSIPFSGFMVVLVVSQALIFRLPRQKAVVTAVIFTIPVVSLYLLQRFSPLSPVDRLRQLVEFSEGQPDNVSFLTTNLIQGGLASLRALGSVPTATQVDIPGIVLILTVASLGALMLRTHNHHQKSQTLGCVSGLIVVGLVTAIHIEVLDSRDVGPIEPRYVLPLTSALVGWWFLHGPDDLFDRIGNLLRGASIVSTASFALMTFSISERFVDRQTYTLRLLPEGPDQWWWSWMPLSPNVPMLFAPIFFWFFVRGVTNGLMFNGRSMGSVDMP
jgi:hypothetical protein